jgi:hypothetical protein
MRVRTNFLEVAEELRAVSCRRRKRLLRLQQPKKDLKIVKMQRTLRLNGLPVMRHGCRYKPVAIFEIYKELEWQTSNCKCSCLIPYAHDDHNITVSTSVSPMILAFCCIWGPSPTSPSSVGNNNKCKKKKGRSQLAGGRFLSDWMNARGQV